MTRMSCYDGVQRLHQAMTDHYWGRLAAVGETEVAVVCTDCRHMQILNVLNSLDGWRQVGWTCENCGIKSHAKVDVKVCDPEVWEEWRLGEDAKDCGNIVRIEMKCTPESVENFKKVFREWNGKSEDDKRIDNEIEFKIECDPEDIKRFKEMLRDIKETL